MTHLRRVCAAAAAATLTAMGTAQGTAITPISATNVDGRGASTAVASNDYHLTQTIYESSIVDRSVSPWSTLLLRPDAAATTPMPAFMRQLTLRMATQGVPSPELARRNSFAANEGSALTVVLADKPVSFPAISGPNAGPAPFAVSIPLDVPFTMLPTAHLLVEVETQLDVNGPPTWPWYPDAETWVARGWTIVPSTFGAACGDGTLSTVASFDPPTQSFETRYVFQNPSSAPMLPAVAWIGTTNRNWGFLPLPFPMVILGAPTCALYTEPALTVHGMTSTTGLGEEYALRVTVPRSFRYLAGVLYEQIAVFDSAAGNVGNLRASAGTQFLFSSPPDPLHALTLERSGTPGDLPTSVTTDLALVLGMQ